MLKEEGKENPEKSKVYIKSGYNISHLPLSLTGWVHPPWSLLRNRIPAVIIARITHPEQLTGE